MTTLPLFWYLPSAAKSERIDASVKLISSLEQLQLQFVPKAATGSASGSDEEEDDDDEEDEEGDGLDRLNSQDVSYSIRRLIRGLASPRESSRLGFSVALTELLSRLYTVTCHQILNLIQENSTAQGSMTGQEERDVLFARLFGIMALIQSELVFRTKPLPSSTTPASSLESYERILIDLVNLSERKSWLRESAWFAIHLAVTELKKAQVEWKDEAAQKTLDVLFVDNKTWSTEKLAVGLELQSAYPELDWKTAFGPTFKTPELLSVGNLGTVSKILKESALDEEGSKEASSSWRPQLTFAWDVLLDQMLPGPETNQTPKRSFQDFYRVVVDEALFSSTSSPQRKYWGFQVFQKALPRVNEETMPMLFTRNFMRSWINHLSNKDRYLHKVAFQTAQATQSFVKDKPQLGFALIVQLTGVNGSQQFDRLTKTKIVESILASLDADGVASYVEYLVAQTNDSEGQSSDATTVNGRRAWIIEQMGALTRNGKIPKHESWIIPMLNWLTINGLFVIKKKSSKSPFQSLQSIPSPVFSDELRKKCQQRLLGCLSDLGHQPVAVGDDKSAKKAGQATDSGLWIAKVLSTIEQLEGDTKHVELAVDFDEDEIAVLKKAKETAEELGKIEGAKQEAAQGARLLILGTVLRQYCADEEEEDFDAESFQSCIDSSLQLVREPSSKKKKGRGSVVEEAPANEPVDVLVDALIGHLEKSTAYMRTVSNQVFSLLSGSVKASTVDLIVTQLEPRDPTKDEDEDEDVEMEADEDEGDEDEDGDESDDESAGDEDEDEDEDEMGDEEAQELRNKIEAALRVNGIEPATGETDDEEDLMDDDQMMAIDEQLAAVFKSRASERSAGKDVNAQREATHFKNRVLDFVDIYLKKQPSNPLVLRFVIPLVTVSTSGSDETQLADKAKGILRSRLGKVKEVPSVTDTEELLPIFDELHKRARRARSGDFVNLMGHCLAYLSKVLVQAKAEKELVETYRQSLKDFATRKNSGLNAHFFQDFIRRSPTAVWSLRKDILELSDSAVNPYRRCQLLQLGEALVNAHLGANQDTTDALSFLGELSKATLKTAQEACKEDSTMTSAQLKDLFKIVLAAVRQTKKASADAVETTWSSSAWIDVKTSLSMSRLKAATGLQKMCEQIAAMTKPASEKQDKKKKNKRKAEEAVSIDVEPVKEESKKHKRKKARGDS